jgi:hypothetical protein
MSNRPPTRQSFAKANEAQLRQLQKFLRGLGLVAACRQLSVGVATLDIMRSGGRVKQTTLDKVMAKLQDLENKGRELR